MRNYTIIRLTFVMLIISCTDRPHNSQAKGAESLIIPSDSNTLYLTYPSIQQSSPEVDKFIDKHEFDTQTVKGYSYVLFRIKEPILSNYKGNKDIYRFTWSRTFDTPLCVRMEKDSDKVVLNLKVLKGQGGYSIPQIADDTTLNLPVEKWQTFISLIHDAQFWNMPNNSYDFGFDGATWLLEGVQAKKYTWVSRWSPGKESPFGKACQYLVSISPIKIDPKNIY